MYKAQPGKLILETVNEFLPGLRAETAQRVVLDMSAVELSGLRRRWRAGDRSSAGAIRGERVRPRCPGAAGRGGGYRGGHAEPAADLTKRVEDQPPNPRADRKSPSDSVRSHLECTDPYWERKDIKRKFKLTFK